jgi:hypothetical protein
MFLPIYLNDEKHFYIRLAPEGRLGRKIHRKFKWLERCILEGESEEGGISSKSTESRCFLYCVQAFAHLHTFSEK